MISSLSLMMGIVLLETFDILEIIHYNCLVLTFSSIFFESEIIFLISGKQVYEINNINKKCKI